MNYRLNTEWTTKEAHFKAGTTFAPSVNGYTANGVEVSTKAVEGNPMFDPYDPAVWPNPGEEVYVIYAVNEFLDFNCSLEKYDPMNQVMVEKVNRGYAAKTAELALAKIAAMGVAAKTAASK